MKKGNNFMIEKSEHLSDIESYKKKYKYVNKFTRGLFFIVGDIISLVIAAAASYVILAPFASEGRPLPLVYSLLLIGSVLAGLSIFRMYVVNWRYTGLRELVRLVCGVTLGGLLSLTLTEMLSTPANYEYAFLALFMMNGVLLVGGFRISKRIFIELVHTPNKKKSRKHTIIFGGESEGEQIVRDILKNDQWNLAIYGIFDDRVMPGLLLHGIRIKGGRKKMIEYIRLNPVDQLIVAFPEIPKKELKQIIDKVKEIRPKMDIKVLPSFHSLTDDPVGVKNIRDISIEDILGREPVNIDFASIKASIRGRTVLVTGAGGSIGSEIVRQCAKLKPRTLVALDIDETELFHLENEFNDTDFDIIPCVASVTDDRKMDKVFGRFQPEVVFHAAAYKHVPMMESFPEEAVRVNVGGTRVLAELSCKHMVDKFVMVSTDKAVNPTNVMGASKRVAEEICMSYNGTCMTKFISVRFGNVLGSRGSVVPLFIDQIKNGGPITVTDPEMQRYFMTIPEAVLLVIQAGSMGEGGEVFVLDMGEPVKIMDMAKDLIRLYGLEPEKDIQIQITGLRPGEKLFEELLNAEEGVIETGHEEIRKAICSRKLSKQDLENKIYHLFELIENGNDDSIRFLLQKIVPTYTYNGNHQSQIQKQPARESHLIG